MSLQTFKKKAVIKHGSRRSAQPPGGEWISQGPFGNNKPLFSVTAPGPVGFSINGGNRNIGYVGQSMRMSKNGTPFTGQFARGHGGHLGKYNKEYKMYNSPHVKASVMGKQFMYIKPSVLSNKGMLSKKYKWVKGGQYPNYWVQPIYPNGPLSDNASQQLYIDQKAAANVIVNDTNTPGVYIDKKAPSCQECKPSHNIAYNTYNNVAANGYFTKHVGIPQSSAQYTLQIQRKCAEPCDSKLKPFPFATNSGNRSSKTSYAPPAILTPIFLSPPM